MSRTIVIITIWTFSFAKCVFLCIWLLWWWRMRSQYMIEWVILKEEKLSLPAYLFACPFELSKLRLIRQSFLSVSSYMLISWEISSSLFSTLNDDVVADDDGDDCQWPEKLFLSASIITRRHILIANSLGGGSYYLHHWLISCQWSLEFT